MPKVALADRILDWRQRRQRATQELDEVKEAGQAAAVEIRSILKGLFGQSNERLVQFNMRPRRTYKRKPAAAPPAADSSSASD